MQPGYQPDTVIIGESTPQMGQATTSPFGATGVIVAARPMQMMGFFDSIKSVLINNYAGFSGRASRSEYWWFLLFAGFTPLIIILILAFFLSGEESNNFYNTLVLIIFIPFIIPWITVSIRRLHDLGKSCKICFRNV